MKDRKKPYTIKGFRIVEVEHGTFTPIVLSTTGGMGREANMFFKKLADKLSRKSGQRYSEAMTFIRKRIRFDLLRTTVIALRGERGLKSSSAVKIADLCLVLCLMRIRCDATRPSNESTTFVILLRHYLHYNVNQHFQGRALQEAEGSFLRPATVKALCHTFFARGFAVLIKHSSSFNPHTRFLEHSAE